MLLVTKESHSQETLKLRWKIGMQEELGITDSTTPQDYIDIMNKKG